MADVHSIATRRFNMKRIKSKNTKPEMLVRKYLHKNGFRFRIHSKFLAGKPDIILPKYKTLVLVQGCFWHGHQNCKDFKIPKTRTEYWIQKINSNIARDVKVRNQLVMQGWKVLSIWACQLEGSHKDVTLKTLLDEITSRTDT